MKIQRFEELQSRKKARSLMNDVYDLTSAAIFEKDWDLRRQIRKTAISVMANIAEGFDAGSGREFIRFLKFSRRSAGELQSHGYIGMDRGLISQTQFKSLYTQAREVKNLIGGMIRYLKTDAGPPSPHPPG